MQRGGGRFAATRGYDLRSLRDQDFRSKPHNFTDKYRYLRRVPGFEGF